MNRAVFLDRDNTLIHNDEDLGDPAKVRLIQGAASAVASLKGLGYKAIVVSNQGGVARGKYGEADVQATNDRINELFRTTSGTSIDRFYYCPYHPEGTVEKYRKEHPWRKPQPGMLLQAAQDFALDMSQCWMIGDQLRDIAAGAAAGVRTILLDPHAAPDQPPLKQENAAAELLGQQAKGAGVLPHFVARHLIEAVRIVAQQRRPENLDESREAAARRPHPATGTAAAATPVPKAAPVASPPAPAPASKPADESANRRPAPAPSSTGMPAPVSAAAPASPSVPPAPPRAPAAPPVTIASPRPERAAGEPDARAADRPTTAGTTTDPTLRQILAELKSQRHSGSEFAYASMLAIVLQIVAVVCLLAALLLGRHNADVFYHWIGVAILTQLATIAMLLFRR